MSDDPDEMCFQGNCEFCDEIYARWAENWERRRMSPHNQTPESLDVDIARVALDSTCLKRVTVCALFDGNWKVLAIESNRCVPINGICQRLEMQNEKNDYPKDSNCNWTHAEIRALDALADNAEPRRAIVYGHRFPCPSCEACLRAAGIVDIRCVETHPWYMVGLRSPERKIEP